MISDKGKRDDILWFTLFHEICHLIKHSKKELFIDEVDTNLNDVEIEADNYAKNILINKNNYNNFIKNKINKNSIIKFCKENNINNGILVGRLQKDNIIKWNEYNDLVYMI